MRIVSLLPSATDILVALGAQDELVGVSHSCGAQWSHVPRLTRTWVDTSAGSAGIDAQVRNAVQPLYELDIDTLAGLAPDVIVSQSLCEVCAIPAGDVESALAALPGRPRLVDLSPKQLDQVPLSVLAVAEATGRSAQAQRWCEDWRKHFAPLRNRYSTAGLRVAFLDWLEPPFAAGHWVPDLIEWLGLESVLARSGEPSYATSWEAVAESRAHLVIAACCGFDETRTRLEAAAAPMDVVVLDGYREFSRPSPALMDSIVTLDRVVAEYLGV